jgi:hypothetical protein
MRVTGELVSGKEAAPILCQFIAERMGMPYLPMGNANAIGILRGSEIIVAVAYNHYAWPNVLMHVAAKPGALWASPGFLYHAFAYPFHELNCRRASAFIGKKNKAARKTVENLGFKYEGTMKEALPADDLICYGMLKSSCRWLGLG